jgi:hypothetical protein
MNRPMTRPLVLALIVFSAFGVATSKHASAQQGPQLLHKTIKVGDLDTRHLLGRLRDGYNCRGRCDFWNGSLNRILKCLNDPFGFCTKTLHEKRFL